MLNFLYPSVRDSQPPRIPGRLANVRGNLQSNFKRMQNYYQTSNHAVRSENVFVRLLNAMNINHDEMGNLYRKVRDIHYQWSSSLGIGSQRQVGKLFNPSVLYGKGVEEVIIDVPFDDSVKLLFTEDWENWDPIRVMNHPFTSFDFQRLDGQPRLCKETGFAVTKVDIGLLYCQYVKWLNSTKSKYEDGTSKTMANFLSSYPLANALKTHIETTWFNRLFHLTLNKPVSDNREIGLVSLTGVYQDSNRIHQELMTTVMKSKTHFHDWCCWVPGIWSKNLKSHFKMDEVRMVWGIKMSYYLSWINLLEWLTQLELQMDTHANSLWINELKRHHKQNQNDKVYGSLSGLSYTEGLTIMEDRIFNTVSLL